MAVQRTNGANPQEFPPAAGGGGFVVRIVSQAGRTKPTIRTLTVRQVIHDTRRPLKVARQHDELRDPLPWVGFKRNAA